jgi:eukaryotic-like serine/threonine-protein kinase
LKEFQHGSEETIFSTALQLPSVAERAAYLDTACAGDQDLRQGIEALLAAQPQLDDFMEDPSVLGASGSKETNRSALLAEESPGTHIGRYKLLE